MRAQGNAARPLNPTERRPIRLLVSHLLCSAAAALAGTALLAGCAGTLPGEARRQEIRGVEHALAAQPDDPELLRRACQLYVEAGDHAKAASVADQAVRLDPHDPRNWTALGDAQRSRGRSAEALAAYERALRLDPGDDALQARIHEVSAGPLDEAELRAARVALERVAPIPGVAAPGQP